MTKSLLSLVAVLGFALSSSAAEFKAGVVNLQKAIQGTSLGKKAKTELEADFEKRRKNFRKKKAI